ncbi:MAG TPA: alpha/beta hydrolase [Verrucomicrobiaceae bacterium]|jgi:pectinesterase
MSLMKSHRFCTHAALAALFAFSFPFPAANVNAQAASKKGKAAADPEGRAIKKALPESVKVERDIVYATYGERKVMLDLYLPKQPASARIPCIVVIHGGGWRSGDKTRFAAIAGELAKQGFAAACIGYRLLPEVEFPAPVVDCKAAVRWVRANAAPHGIDPDRIGAIGGSAGGHLVAMLGTSDKESKLEGNGGNPGISSRIQAVVAMATPADMTSFAERAKIDRDLAVLISPITHVSKDSAPVLLMHGTKDAVVPMAQSEMLLEKYHKAGASAALVKIEGAPHAFWNGQWFDETMKQAGDFFRKELGSGAVAHSGTE